jgi:hypothetical protein
MAHWSDDIVQLNHEKAGSLGVDRLATLWEWGPISAILRALDLLA